MLHKPPGDCSTRRLRSDRHDLVGAVHALAAVLEALVAVGTARADDLSEAEREFCRDSADMALSVSRDLVTAPTTMAEYQSYRDALLKLLTHEIEMLRSRHCPQAEEAADQAAATMIRIAISAKSVRGGGIGARHFSLIRVTPVDVSCICSKAPFGAPCHERYILQSFIEISSKRVILTPFLISLGLLSLLALQAPVK